MLNSIVFKNKQKRPARWLSRQRSQGLKTCSIPGPHVVGGENEAIMLGTWPMTCTCVSRHLLEQEHTHKTNKSIRKALRVK